MVVLRKLKASTLMETLVATVLIVVVFMVASMILNNLFLNTMRNNTTEIDAHMHELEYLYVNQKFTLPHQEEFGVWKISVTSYKEGETTMIEFEAKNSDTNKTISKEVHEIE